MEGRRPSRQTSIGCGNERKEADPERGGWIPSHSKEELGPVWRTVEKGGYEFGGVGPRRAVEPSIR